MDTNIIYDFEVQDTVLPEYKVCHTVLEWLRGNLNSLTDDDNKRIFNKVNLGYNESSLKGLGKRPVADIYLNNVDYRDYLDYNLPNNLNTVLIVSLKGNANKTYSKALELHDYILQEFIENTSWRELESIVKETHISNSQVQINQNSKVWSNLIIFELNHVLV